MIRLSKDNCATKYCRGKVALTYLGVPLCQECYEKKCDDEEALMKAIREENLTRY